MEQVQTARELNLMRGFPPSPETRVTHANQFHAPYNRWNFQNAQKINCSADVWRGNRPVAHFDADPLDLDQIPYHIEADAMDFFGNMLDLSYTDGIVVLYQGRMVYERYLNGMQPQTRHAWTSCSKSMTGTLAAMLISEGLLDPEACITTYLPELEGSGFSDATVRQVMDMTTSLKFSDDSSNTGTDMWKYAIAMGLLAKPEGYTGPETIYDYLATIKKDGNHGNCFAYITPNTDVLGWLIKRVLDKPLADVLSERIWSKVGAERDAVWLVDHTTAEIAGLGLLTTLRDMARFGQMMLQKGLFHGQQIVPVEVIKDIERGADRDAFARGSNAGLFNKGFSYHHHWWVSHNEHGAYFALGYGGQILYIDPIAHLVVAKYSSYPSPAKGGSEFFHALDAISMVAKVLAAE